MAPVALGGSTKAKTDVPVEGLPVRLTAAGRLLDRLGRMASLARRQAVVDLFASLLMCVGELVLWALLVVIYAGFVWIAWNELEVHRLLSHVLGTSVITYKQYLGMGFMIAFLANAFTGRTDAIVKRAMRRVVSALL